MEQADENAMHVLDQMVDNFIVESERHALDWRSYKRLGMDKQTRTFCLVLHRRGRRTHRRPASGVYDDYL